MTPKQAAEKEVYKRIVTKKQAKERSISWIESAINKNKDVLPLDTIEWWNEVIKEINNL